MCWQKISKDRIQKEMNGFFVIKPEVSTKPIPLFCPLCKNLLKNALDSQYYHKWEACYDCATIFAEPNREKWLSGWRPDF